MIIWHPAIENLEKKASNMAILVIFSLFQAVPGCAFLFAPAKFSETSKETSKNMSKGISMIIWHPAAEKFQKKSDTWLFWSFCAHFGHFQVMHFYLPQPNFLELTGKLLRTCLNIFQGKSGILLLKILRKSLTFRPHFGHFWVAHFYLSQVNFLKLARKHLRTCLNVFQ